MFDVAHAARRGMRAFAVMAKISILDMFVSRGREGGREVEEKRPVFVSKKISVITDDPLPLSSSFFFFCSSS